jgi:hypothetical protein
MAERSLAPIMIGITGKRDLLGKDDAIRGALGSCFDLLDSKLPASRKLLLTGLAAGADTIAAQLAQERGWKIIAVLPFDLDLYAQDFDEAGSKELRGFVDPGRGFLADPKHGKVLVLDPLLDPQTNKPFEPKALARRPERPNPVRSDHYEQVGLFIAERCALLIGVMSAQEQPDRVGGTARIVDYRLRGEPDSIAERVINHSEALRKPVDLDSPQPGPVWLIDLDAADDSSVQPLRSVQLWISRTDRHGGTEIEKVGHPGAEGLVSRLRLASRIDVFNQLAMEVGEDKWQKEVAARARRDEQWQSEIEGRAGSSLGDASARLSQIRMALSVIQGSKKRALTVATKALAILFVVAIIAVEVHLQFESIYLLILYIAVLLVVLLVFGYARMGTLQQYSEDYRAVAEAARVQLAWWDAGLSAAEYHVDRVYLCGTVGSLAVVRAAIRHLIDAILIESQAPQPSPAEVQRWVKGQISFFESRTDERRSSLARFEDIIWFCFLGSLGMAATLLPLTMAISNGNAIIDWIDTRLDLMQPSIVAWLAPLVAFAAVYALFRLSRLLSSRVKIRQYGFRRWLLEALNFLIAFTAGVFFSIGVYGLVYPPYDFARTLAAWGVSSVDAKQCTADCAHGVAHKLIAAVTVVIASVAGAVRFYAERLAFEVELHSYRETLGTFKRAQADLDNADGNGPAEAAKRCRIILELGKYALRENESWIRAHRVRPLEPHV